MPAPMHGTVICTVVTSNYLHYALALAKSVRKFHAELPLLICIADRNEHLGDPQDQEVEFLFADELGIPQWPRFSFQYTAFELSCALKPTVMRYCFSRQDVQRVVYLDADMQLFAPLNELADISPRYSVALTPHLLSPLPHDSHLPSCETFARAGAYNGGFVSVNRGNSGFAFLDWWGELMRTKCVVRLREGLFVDQHPLDLVPGLFDNVHIHRRPGFHLAYWNLLGRQVFAAGNAYQLNDGNELTLFHFSGIDPDDRTVLSKHQDRLTLKEFPAVEVMIGAYLDELNRCGRSHYESLRYKHATLSCGTDIQDSWRESIRQNHAALKDIEDPFDAARYPDLPERFERALTQYDTTSLTRKRRVSKRLETAVKWMLGRQSKAA